MKEGNKSTNSSATPEGGKNRWANLNIFLLINKLSFWHVLSFINGILIPFGYSLFYVFVGQFCNNILIWLFLKVGEMARVPFLSPERMPLLPFPP